MDLRANDNAEGKFMAAFEQYKDEIFRHCYLHVFDRETAFDLAQEAFMNTWLYVAKGNDIANVRAFLYRAAGNLCLNYKRRHKPVSLDQLLEDGFDVGTDDEGHHKDTIAERQALTALAKIREPYRTAVTLRYVEGLMPAEIASILKKPVNTVSAHITRGLKALRKLLKDAL